MSFIVKGPTTAPIPNLFWAKVVSSPPAGASWARDEESPVYLYGMQSIFAKEFKRENKVERRPFKLTINGAVIVEVSDDPAEPFAESDSGGSGVGFGGTTYGVSGAFAAKVTLSGGVTIDTVIAANPLQRSVTIQNLGAVAVWVSRLPTLDTTGNNADALLSASGALNDGTGGIVTFDGFTGDIRAFPVGGAAGAVLLISATRY